MKTKILGMVFLVVLVFGLTGLAGAQTYKWTDSNGTIHFTDTPPVDQGNVQRVKEGPINTYSSPKNTSAKKPSESQAVETNSNDDSQMRSRASYYCSQGDQLRNNIKQARAAYHSYQGTPIFQKSEATEKALYRSILSAEKALEDFQERAREDRVPPGWVDCRFE